MWGALSGSSRENHFSSQPSRASLLSLKDHIFIHTSIIFLLPIRLITSTPHIKNKQHNNFTFITKSCMNLAEKILQISSDSWLKVCSQYVSQSKKVLTPFRSTVMISSVTPAMSDIEVPNKPWKEIYMIK